jgi:hypothetical protein
MNNAAPKLLIHVPHSSTKIPDDVWQEFVVPRDAIENEVLESADLYTELPPGNRTVTEATI